MERSKHVYAKKEAGQEARDGGGERLLGILGMKPWRSNWNQVVFKLGLSGELSYSYAGILPCLFRIKQSSHVI